MGFFNRCAGIMVSGLIFMAALFTGCDDDVKGISDPVDLAEQIEGVYEVEILVSDTYGARYPAEVLVYISRTGERSIDLKFSDINIQIATLYLAAEEVAVFGDPEVTYIYYGGGTAEGKDELLPHTAISGRIYEAEYIEIAGGYRSNDYNFNVVGSGKKIDGLEEIDMIDRIVGKYTLDGYCQTDLRFFGYDVREDYFAGYEVLVYRSGETTVSAMLPALRIDLGDFGLGTVRLGPFYIKDAEVTIEDTIHATISHAVEVPLEELGIDPALLGITLPPGLKTLPLNLEARITPGRNPEMILGMQVNMLVFELFRIAAEGSRK